MKKKNLFSGFNAKIALIAVALTGGILAGCYKDEGLDVAGPGDVTTTFTEATYSITGTVTDVNTGALIEDVNITTDKGTLVNNKGNYTIEIKNIESNQETVNLTFQAEGYNEGKTIARSVVINKVGEGQSVVYPLSVAMKPNVKEEPRKDKEAVYNLTFVVKDSKTMAPVTGITPTVEGQKSGDYYKAGTVKVSTGATTDYYASVTVVDLPAIFDTEVKTIDKIIEILVTPIDKTIIEPEPDTFTNISGVVVDKNGAFVTADKIVLLTKSGTPVKGQEVSGTNTFRFTINNKEEEKEYKVQATKGNETVTSAVYNINGGNVFCTLIFENIGDKPELKDVKYNLYVNILDAATNAPVAPEKVNLKIDGNPFTTFPARELAAGTYKLTTDRTDIENTNYYYYATQTYVVFDAAKDETGSILDRVVTIYLIKGETVTPPEQDVIFNIYGEVVDKTGRLATVEKIWLETATGQAVDNVAPVYHTDHFMFQVKIAQTRAAANSYRVGAMIEGIKAYSNTITYTAGGSSTVSAFSTVKFEGIEIVDGKIVGEKPIQSDINVGDKQNEQGTLEEEVTINLNNTTETVTNENGENTTVNVPNDEVILAKGTTILSPENTPVSNLIIRRNILEEKAEEVLRSYVGSPNGTTFSTPLEIKFYDVYEGQLGNLALEYKIDGQWGTSMTNKDNTVAVANKYYTMELSHFSEFRAIIPTEPIVDKAGKDSVENATIPETNYMNNSDKAIDVTVDMKFYDGYAYVTPLKDVLKEAGYTNTYAIGALIEIIEDNLLTQYGISVKGFKEKEISKKYQLGAYTLLESVSTVAKYKVTNYTIKAAGKTITFGILTPDSKTATLNTQRIGHSHSHSHGHGVELNAGGGIIIAE